MKLRGGINVPKKQQNARKTKIYQKIFGDTKKK